MYFHIEYPNILINQHLLNEHYLGILFVRIGLFSLLSHCKWLGIFYGFSKLFSLARIIFCDMDQEKNQKEKKKNSETEPVKRENLAQC